MQPLLSAACLALVSWTLPAVAQEFSVENTVRMIHVGASPKSAVISNDGRHLYVGNLGGRNISVIDTITQKVSSIEIGEAPHGLVLSHDGRRLYALAGGDAAEGALVVVN